MNKDIPKQLLNCKFARVKYRSKEAFEKEWQKKPYTYEEIQKYFPKENYGVVCCSDLRVLDDDTPDKRLLKLFKDNFGETFRVRDHLYFNFDNKHSKKIILYNENKEHLGEIQGENTYVVGPGSTHPSGEVYEIKNDESIKAISYEKFMDIFKGYINSNTDIKYTENFAATDNELVKEIIPKWKEGDRQNLTLSLAGYLRKEKGYGIEHTLSIIRNICKEANDLDVHEREMAVRSTYDSDEGEIKGITGLKERDIIKKINLDVFGRWGQAKAFYEQQPFFYDENKCFWIWDSDTFCYKQIDDVGILNCINNAMNVGIIESKSRNEILNVLKQLGRQKIPKKINITWIQFKDKIYDFVTGEVFNSSPEYLFSNPILYSLGKSENTPNIDELFISWVGEEHKQELYEIIAFCCITDYFIHRLFFFYGNGANGKSTFDNLITKFIGEQNITSTSLERLQANPRFETANFHKKLVVFMSEISEDEIKKSDTIKRASGQEPVHGEYKGKGGFDFINYAKILIPTNKVPKSSDDSDGFYRRTKIIDFPNQFQKEKDVLSEIPEEEFNNLALKCLNIAKKLWVDRTFTNDGDFSQRRKRYQERSTNIIERFIDSEYDSDDLNENTAFDIFYSQLSNFLKKSNHKIMSKQEVSKKIRNLGWEMKVINFQDVYGKYYQKKCILGLKLKKKQKSLEEY